MTVPADSLFHARVMHFRRLPDGTRTHRFSYAVFRLWLDIDRTDALARRLRWFSAGRFNLLSFHKGDHGPRDGSSLREWVEAHLAAEGLAAPAQIRLYCFPRVFGRAFNPLSAYFCYDAASRLNAVIYEVRNTDGDLCPYVFALDPACAEAARHATAKTFYVSPFIAPEQRYSFVLHAPRTDRDAASLSVRIRVEDADGLTLIATENTGGAIPLTDAAILGALRRVPLMSVKVIGAIYFEALRLRLKGARFFRHPGGNGRFPELASAPGDSTRAENAG